MLQRFKAVGLGLWLISSVVGRGGASEILMDMVSSAHVFGGRTNNLSFNIWNHGDETLKAELFYQVYQLSHQLETPISPRKRWRSVEVPRESGRQIELKLVLPEVRVRTEFRLACWADEKEIAGDMLLVVQPSDPLEYLRKLSAAGSVAVWDSSGRLFSGLEQLAIPVRALREPDEARAFSGRLLIATAFAAGTDELRERMMLFDQLNQRDVAVVCFYREDRGVIGMPVILFSARGKHAATVLAPRSTFSSIHAAQQQSDLADLIQSALRRNPLTLISYNEHEYEYANDTEK